MSILRLLKLSPNNRLILSSWFDGVDPDGSVDRPEVDAALDALGYTERPRPPYTRHQAAVAAIAMAGHAPDLPFESEARNIVSGVLRRHIYGPGTRNACGEQCLLRICWRVDEERNDVFWENAYHLVSVWSLNRRVLIESLDNDDRGYSDFAIGHIGDRDVRSEGAGVILKAHWRRLRAIYGDVGPYVLSIEPVLAAPLVEQWIKAVWPEPNILREYWEKAAEPE